MINFIFKRVGYINSILFCLLANYSTAQPAIRLKKHADGFLNPVGFAVIKDDPSRLFVVEQGGLIKVVSKNGKTTNTIPFLNVSTLLGSSGGEKGLLGLAFHPQYTSNRKFYINYTQEKAGVLTTIISQFLADASQPDVAISDSETVILQYTQPYGNHNGGDIQFGSDGYLYIASGDGGRGGDPHNNGQMRSTVLGKILRIDVDNSSNGQNYAIPASNPFVSDPSALDEIWAYGVRNPWRISFDMEKGDLFIADVGQQQWEEVNFQSVSSTGGQNYGWNKMEGFHCYLQGCNLNDKSLQPPILEYEHINGACSITGGYVHRGENKFMNGRYFYGDYCNGNIWSTKRVDDKWVVKLMYESTGLYISSFGQDTDGNVYVVDIAQGAVYKLLRCADVKKFKFKVPSGKKGCNWVKQKENRIKKHCKKNNVKRNCRKTCGKCGI